MSDIEESEHPKRRATDVVGIEALSRRASDQAMLSLIEQTHNSVKELNDKFAIHLRDEPLALAEAVAALMIKAFPEGDPSGHKAYHEAQMKAAEDRAKFWKTMLFEVTKYGLLGVFGWLALRIWTIFLEGPK